MSRRSVIATNDNAQVVGTLSALRTAENECRRCPLYKNATRAVPGEGPRRASLMLVGEQPGDKEDLAGLPFVGPAGRILDRALADARIDRKKVFVTNAVKHFKHEMRGKRRLHKRPNAYEIERCRWWQDLERAIVKPAVSVALERPRLAAYSAVRLRSARLGGKQCGWTKEKQPLSPSILRLC